MKLDAETLRSRRLQLGLSQRELARAARVTQPLISRLEATGCADRLECQTLERILDRLSLDLISALSASELGSPQTTSGTTDAAGEVMSFSATATDLRLLHLALHGKLTVRQAALMSCGNVSVYRLRNAGLVAIRDDGTIAGTERSHLIFALA